MAKSSMEKQYEKLIVRHISNMDIDADQRAFLFLDFFNNSEVYYENLCTYLYEMSIGELEAPIWMKPNGDVYACSHCKNKYDSYLLHSYELPVFNGDLQEHLEIIFTRIYSLSKFQVFCNRYNCIFSVCESAVLNS